jgi:hypothetical protein
MSYCRWSSDGFQCDVYVYESADGWITHVAAKRRAARAPELDWSTPERWAETHAAYRAFMDDEINHPSLPIGLSEDGQTFCDASPAACAAQLLRLKALGYQVPQDAIEALLDEARPA